MKLDENGLPIIGAGANLEEQLRHANNYIKELRDKNLMLSRLIATAWIPVGAHPPDTTTPVNLLVLREVAIIENPNLYLIKLGEGYQLMYEKEGVREQVENHMLWSYRIEE